MGGLLASCGASAKADPARDNLWLGAYSTRRRYNIVMIISLGFWFILFGALLMLVVAAVLFKAITGRDIDPPHDSGEQP